ncbi:hypothetical protein PRIPAC_74764 [Pristionchus pacificus]|uniref:Uncharacterized protein n=1 Tax=Pristionchus pacificus TaxID=54126 RepID=A0A2A6C6A6_PRIPA|nr:hypothetical protein PRIPAC_74764 [Pristionchus pacificus]|eukprot:PDM73742.1 hypothetical protein PRIPAC_41098 [Pristionchus pacificus]
MQSINHQAIAGFLTRYTSGTGRAMRPRISFTDDSANFKTDLITLVCAPNLDPSKKAFSTWIQASDFQVGSKQESNLDPSSSCPVASSTHLAYKALFRSSVLTAFGHELKIREHLPKFKDQKSTFLFASSIKLATVSKYWAALQIAILQIRESLRVLQIRAVNRRPKGARPCGWHAACGCSGARYARLVSCVRPLAIASNEKNEE